jgi:subtilisin family serine protease
MMTPFWQKALSLWSGFIVLFGLVLAGAGFAATDGIALAIFDLFGASDFAPDSLHRFSIGLMGAVTMGWGATYYVTFQALHQLPAHAAAPLWRLVTAGALAWYVIDCVISVATGIAFNAVSNTALIAAYLLITGSAGVLRTPSLTSRDYA